MKSTLQNGFTLVEMAIVLMIVGLLLGGMLVPLSAQMDQRNVSDTQKSLAEIKEALIGYALANGRLPCPAVPSTPTGQTVSGVSAGTEVPLSSNICSILTGVLPWATLGVNETDAWGNRYTYRVDTNFSDSNSNTTYGSGCSPSPAPTNASFALCSSGTINVLSAATGGVTIAGNIPAVIISHGKNAAGAYTTQGTYLAVGNNPDEKENSDGSANPNYVSHTPTPTFDDLVVWISPNILLNRMVAAGKLP
jgi:prepilin-type N-terminal cleavage/methylation domain-containing protein